jgi:hypothetical protein
VPDPPAGQGARQHVSPLSMGSSKPIDVGIAASRGGGIPVGRVSKWALVRMRLAPLADHAGGKGRDTTWLLEAEMQRVRTRGRIQEERMQDSAPANGRRARPREVSP